MSKFRVLLVSDDAPMVTVVEADKLTFMGTGGLKFEAQAGGFVAAYHPDRWLEVSRLEEDD